MVGHVRLRTPVPVQTGLLVTLVIVSAITLCLPHSMCFQNVVWFLPESEIPVQKVNLTSSPLLPSPASHTGTGGGMGGDPHFSVILSDGSNFCYSIQGLAGFPFSLVSSQHFVMNAVFVKPPLKLKQYSTLLGEIGEVVHLLQLSLVHVVMLCFHCEGVRS